MDVRSNTETCNSDMNLFVCIPFMIVAVSHFHLCWLHANKFCEDLGWLLLVDHNSSLSNLQVKVKPGESALAFYTAENRSSTPIVGVSTYNVTPMKVHMLLSA